MRQLENAVFRAVVLADGDEIGADEFPQLALSADAHGRARDRAAPDEAPQPLATPPPPMILDERAAVAAARTASAAMRSRCIDAAGDVRPLEEIEAEVIRFAIAHYRGQMSEVARRLRIGRSTLYRKLDEIGLGDAAKSGDAGRKRGQRVTRCGELRACDEPDGVCCRS